MPGRNKGWAFYCSQWVRMQAYPNILTSMYNSASMQKQSLLLYLFTAAVNIILLLPVFFSPFIMGPLHLLLNYVTYDWLFNQKRFHSNWNALVFSGIPIVAQFIFILVLVKCWQDSPPLIDLIIVFIFMLLSLTEFGMLLIRYSVYRQKKRAS